MTVSGSKSIDWAGLQGPHQQLAGGDGDYCQQAIDEDEDDKGINLFNFDDGKNGDKQHAMYSQQNKKAQLQRLIDLVVRNINNTEEGIDTRKYYEVNYGNYNYLHIHPDYYILIRMRNCFILLVLISLVAMTTADGDNQSNGGPQTIYVEGSDCTMTYQQRRRNQITFINCFSHAISSTHWQACFKQCCSISAVQQYPTPSAQGLTFCQELSQQAEQNVIPIVVGVIVGVLFVAICLFCICIVRRRCRTRAVSSPFVYNSHYLSQHVPKAIEWKDQRQVNQHIDIDIIWSTRAKYNQPLRTTNQPCAICLQEETTAELFCGHQYHPVCIGEWLRKSSVCPCCRLENVRGLKAYCRQCRWRYFVCTSGLMSDECRVLPLRCEFCKDLQEEGQEQLVDGSLTDLMPQKSDHIIKFGNNKVKKVIE